ncbi:MAG: glutathione S-transferase N-terminal domain-containing protein [Chloroflexi bacterium]|nr:glutathione S-transferase N-terminal domain-containing protein [Chloroflexota bacterium]
MSAEQIRVYGTTWCPDCARAKKVLNEHEIAFEWIDITGNKEAIAYVENINGGYRSVPTILFPDGSVLVEPSNAELKEKLASTGATSGGT